MTKMFEEYWRGRVSGALEYFKSQPARGEFTLVIEGKGKSEGERWSEAQLLAAARTYEGKDRKATEIAAELAEQSGWSKKDVYRLINRAGEQQ
jgi:16S rRNA (cytidine1402-2'-O)-methyltransferase